MREGGIVTSQAVLIAVGIDWDGRRQILGVEMANRQSHSVWKTFLLGLREHGLTGMELVVGDDHAGLRAAVHEVLSEAAYQRCYVHFLRNVLDHLPRKTDDKCLQELRWLYDRRSVEEARRDLEGLDGQVGGALPAPGCLGRGDDKGDVHVLPLAALASQASQEHQQARAPE